MGREGQDMVVRPFYPFLHPARSLKGLLAQLGCILPAPQEIDKDERKVKRHWVPRQQPMSWLLQVSVRHEGPGQSPDV